MPHLIGPHLVGPVQALELEQVPLSGWTMLLIAPKVTPRFAPKLMPRVRKKEAAKVSDNSKFNSPVWERRVAQPSSTAGSAALVLSAFLF